MVYGTLIIALTIAACASAPPDYCPIPTEGCRDVTPTRQICISPTEDPTLLRLTTITETDVTTDIVRAKDLKPEYRVCYRLR